MMKQLHAILQMGLFRRSRGCYLNKNVPRASSRTPIFQHNSYSKFPTLNWASASTMIVQQCKGRYLPEKIRQRSRNFMFRSRRSPYVRPFKNLTFCGYDPCTKRLAHPCPRQYTFPEWIWGLVSPQMKVLLLWNISIS